MVLIVVYNIIKFVVYYVCISLQIKSPDSRIPSFILFKNLTWSWIRGGFTYYTNDMNIWFFDSRRGWVNKYNLQSHPFAECLLQPPSLPASRIGIAVRRHPAATDQRHLDAKAFTTDIAAKVQNDLQENVSNLHKLMGWRLKRLRTLFTRIWSSPRSRRGGCPNWQTRRWRRESQDLRGVLSDFHRSFLTILETTFSLLVSRAGLSSTCVFSVLTTVLLTRDVLTLLYLRCQCRLLYIDLICIYCTVLSHRWVSLPDNLSSTIGNC